MNRSHAPVARKAIVPVCALLAAMALPADALADANGQPATAPARLKITIGRDTTFVDGPVNADGTINYLAAYNQRLSKGVTPRNNAAVLLAQAIGPELIPKSNRAEALKRLGIASLPEKGEYFVCLADYAKDSNQADDQLAEARTRLWRPKDYPELAAWLKANEKPLALIVAASKRLRWFVPLLPDDSSTPMIYVLLPNFSGVRKAVKALTARAMLRFKQGDADGAWADLLAVHRLARLISQDDLLILRLVGVGSEVIACEADEALAASALTAGQAKLLLAELQGLAPLPPMTDAINMGERLCVLDAVMAVARASLKGQKTLAQFIKDLDESVVDPTSPQQGRGADPPLTPVPDILDWDLILATFNGWYDKLAATADPNKTYAERCEAAVRLGRDMKEFEATLARRAKESRGLRGFLRGLSMPKQELRTQLSKDVANLLVSILLLDISRASQLRDQAVMELEVAKLALALAAHKAEKGRFPDRLDGLKPAYLKHIPKDLFTEKPLVYKRQGKGYILYSLGPNMKDDGARAPEDDHENYDIVVKAPR